MIKRDLLMVLVTCAVAWAVGACLGWLAANSEFYRFACATVVSIVAMLAVTRYILKRLIGGAA